MSSAVGRTVYVSVHTLDPARDGGITPQFRKALFSAQSLGFIFLLTANGERTNGTRHHARQQKALQCHSTQDTAQSSLGDGRNLQIGQIGMRKTLKCSEKMTQTLCHRLPCPQVG